MILLWAVALGFFAGLTRAVVAKRRYQPPALHHLWLVIVAYIPQLIAFVLPLTRKGFPDPWVPAFLVSSQLLLLVFAGLNIRASGMWLLGLGLALNFLVIILNGGMMPISPETVNRLLPGVSPDLWHTGMRLGTGKDVILQQGATQLWFLSDRFVLPLIRNRVAFSIGDVLIALGAIWILWSAGGPGQQEQRSKHHDSKNSGYTPQQ